MPDWRSSKINERNFHQSGHLHQSLFLSPNSVAVSKRPLIFFASANTSFKKLLSLDKHVKTKNIHYDQINFWKNIPIIKKLNHRPSHLLKNSCRKLTLPISLLVTKIIIFKKITKDLSIDKDTNFLSFVNNHYNL